MKRRIVSMFLVVVMVVLSLASCSYSYAKDDLTSYATFSAEDKKAFEEAIQTLLIEDGDFTGDSAVRLEKVMENIYSSLASGADADKKETTGIPGAHDLVYYNYYCTATFGEGDAAETVILYAANMKSGSSVKVQLGSSTADNKVNEGVFGILGNYDFTDKVYTTDSSSTTLAAKGDVAFVTYSTSVTETVDGVDKVVNKTYTNHMVVIGEGDDTFEGYLNGKKVNISLENKKIGDVDYSDIKINWIAKGEKAGTFKDVTFTETKKVSDTTGTSRDLKDVELTYHIFPAHYVKVDDYNAVNLINTIFGKNISMSNIGEVLFGSDYAEKTDEEKEELVKDYKFVEGEDEFTLEKLIEKIAKLQAEYAELKDLYEKADESLETAKTAHNKAKEAVDAAGESATDTQKSELEKATKELEDKQKDYDEAKKNYDEKLAERDGKVKLLLDKEGMADKLVRGYKISTFDYLQETYNHELKMNIAKEVYFYITKFVKVSGTPEKAVEESYKQIIENYEYDFYTGTYDSSKKISNYKQYGGSFKKFLIAKVTSDIKTVSTYEDALAAIEGKAVEYVTPLVRLYTFAKEYALLVDEDKFDEYKEDTDNNYSYNEYYYGEGSVRHAYQLDLVLNHILDSKEVKGEADENGFVTVTVTYTRLGYSFGDPASENQTEEK